MAYFSTLPATFKAYLDSLPEGLKLTLYIKDLPKGHSIMLLYTPDAHDSTTTIKTEPRSAEKMLGLMTNSEVLSTAVKSEPKTPQPKKSKLRSIKTVPDLFNKFKTQPSKHKAGSPIQPISRTQKTKKSTKQRSYSSYSLPRQTTMARPAIHNWHYNYPLLNNPDNWTCRAFNTELGWYRFLQNKLTGDKTAVHTATGDIINTTKTVYLSKDIAMQSVINYATCYPDVDFDPMTAQQKQVIVTAIIDRLYSDNTNSV